MRNYPLISIVVPVYNVEKYVEVCLNSILEQTYQNLELIIVNDGSTDNSLAKVRTVSSNRSNVIIVNQENRGLGEARNTGIKNCKGEFVLFIDSDDWIEERMVELLVAAAVASNADICCCGFNIVETNRLFPKPVNLELNLQTDYLGLCLNDLRNEKNRISTTVWGKLFKLDFIRGNLLWFKLPYFEDTPFFLEASYYANKVVFIKETLYNYAFRADSISKLPLSRKKLDCFYKAENLIVEFIQTMGLNQKYHKRFGLFRFQRLLLYGGFRDLYLSGSQKHDPEICQLFLEKFNTERFFLKHYKPVDLCPIEKKTLRVLKIGVVLNRFSWRLTHFYFSLVGKVYSSGLIDMDE